jgi:hypothetical protein
MVILSYRDAPWFLLPLATGSVTGMTHFEGTFSASFFRMD